MVDHDMIGGPENAASGHQWDDAANEENRDRATADVGLKVTNDAQNKSGNKG